MPPAVEQLRSVTNEPVHAEFPVPVRERYFCANHSFQHCQCIFIDLVNRTIAHRVVFFNEVIGQQLSPCVRAGERALDVNRNAVFPKTEASRSRSTLSLNHPSCKLLY